MAPSLRPSLRAHPCHAINKASSSSSSSPSRIHATQAMQAAAAAAQAAAADAQLPAAAKAAPPMSMPLPADAADAADAEALPLPTPTVIFAVDAANADKLESSPTRVLIPAEIEYTPSKPNEGFIEEWLKAANNKMNCIFQEFYYMRNHFTAVKEEIKNLRVEMAKIRNEMAQIRGVEMHMMGEITAFKDKQPIIPTPAIDHETSSKIKDLEQKIDKESKTWASLFKAKENNDTSMVTAKGNSSLSSSSSLVSATINEEKLCAFKGLNIRISGVQDNGNALEEAQSFVRDTLGQDASGIEKAWCMRQDTKILIVRFVTKTARLSTLRQRPKLMGTQLFMDDDLTHMQVEERRQAFAKGKELGKKVVYRDGQIRFFDIKASSSAK